MIAEAIVPIPVEYLPTGDHALLIAWVQEGRDLPGVVLCLEDGSVVSTFIKSIKFDYRWSEAKQSFVDVSGIPIDKQDAPKEGEEDEGADADQEPPDDGGQGVPGQLPEAD